MNMDGQDIQDDFNSLSDSLVHVETIIALYNLRRESFAYFLESRRA